jgi:hypothetical protein|tara:strand:- start:2006 stop:2293 length:288 start_codon:yes stop_codon:yes gene_type:complete
MKKLFIIISIFTVNKTFSQTRIYCKPDIKKCINNLENLDYWLWQDGKDKKIPYEIWKQYELVITHTISSLEMILENKNQCDTTNETVKFKLNEKI